MARKLPEEFEEKEIGPLCVAGNLEEANKIERILDKENIDYTVDIVPLSRTFGLTVAEGVMFLVHAGQLAYCRSLLEHAGLSNLIVED